MLRNHEPSLSFRSVFLGVLREWSEDDDSHDTSNKHVHMFHDQNCLWNPTCLYELQSSTKPTTFKWTKKNAGGWTNPPEKYARQTWIISPGRAKKFKFVWNHHLDLDLDKLKVLFFKTTLSTLKCRCNDSLPFYLQEGLSDDMKKFRLALCLAWHSTQEPLQMPLFCLFFFFWGGCPKFGTSSLSLKKSWKAEDQDGGHH